MELELLVGRYKIIELIATGGSSEVYLASDQPLDRKVAIKRSNLLLLSEEGRERFLREARILAGIRHRHIITIYSLEEEGDHLYIVMEYADQGNLLERIVASPGGLPVDDVVDLGIAMCRALAAAHARGIIHRDVKPSNILLITEAGEEKPVPKLADLGIARDAAAAPLTTEGGALGTLAYMPPEVLGFGGGKVDARRDVYGLGAVLYEALTGRRLRGNEVAQIISNLDRAPTSPRAIRDDTPIWLERIVLKALASKPDGRYPDMRAMLADLEAGTRSLEPKVLSQSAEPWSADIGRFRLVRHIVSFTQRIVAVVAITGRRAVVSAVTRLGSAIQHRRVRSVGPSTDIPAKSLPPSPAPIVTDLKPPVDRPTMRLRREHTGWTSHSQKSVIEDLILHEDFERLKSFVVHSEGGRFVLTGYGRFGGTSLIKGAMSRAKRELQQRGLTKAALLVFYLNVREGSGGIQEIEIEANEISIGRLVPEHGTSADDAGWEALKQHASRIEPLSDTSPASFAYQFTLTMPLDPSFLRRSGLTDKFLRKPAVREFDLAKLVIGLNDFFTEDKSNSHLQEIVLQLIGSEVLPSRVVFVLDRVRHLETLELLVQLELFKNERIIVLAVTRKEDFDRWEECEERLSKIGFKKWYLPCLWQIGADYMRRINKILLEPYGSQDSEAEDLATVLRKHLEFVGKGVLGNVLEELKHPKYWSSDVAGNFYLRLDALPHQDKIHHNAWMQNLLTMNWPAILANLFAGRGMDEREDRARLGVYHLLDWIAEQQIFSREQLLEASCAIPIRISDNSYVVNEMLENLIRVLERNRYLHLVGSQYRVVWDKSNPPKPRKASVRIPTTLSQPTDISSLAPESTPREKVGDQVVGSPTEPVSEPRTKKVIQFTESEDSASKKWEIAIEEPRHPDSEQILSRGGTEVSDKTKILVVFANPKGSDPLRLGEEARIIRECIERSKNRGNLHYEILQAVRVKDVQRALLEDNYHVVQFSGHATPAGNLAFEDETGKPKLIPQQALASLFSSFDSIECVILNACYSVSQGESISLGVPFTIAMDGPISDDAAQHFTRGFYDTIGAGRDYRFAYRMGCNAIAMEGYPEETTPQFLEKQPSES